MHATTVDEWVARWQQRVCRADKLTTDEWACVKVAVTDSYVVAGLKPPAGVIRTRSPREAMRMALAHQAEQSMAEVNAAARVSEAIRDREGRLLDRRFTGTIAARVDTAGLNPNVWGMELHPHMLRPPCTGNLRPGLAAEVSWLLEIGQYPRPGSVRRGLHAIIERSLGGPARLLADIAFVSDMPTKFLRDEEGRPHHDAGPAITWADGSELNFWHGVRVPEKFFSWTPDRALSEVNVEVRRCAFERLGVDAVERSLTLLDEAPDPANPPHVLRLYDLPRPWLSGRLLVVDNASVDKGGHRRRFQIFVPPHITDPVEAAANSFGLTVEQYSQLQRAT